MTRDLMMRSVEPDELTGSFFILSAAIDQYENSPLSFPALMKVACRKVEARLQAASVTTT